MIVQFAVERCGTAGQHLFERSDNVWDTENRLPCARPQGTDTIVEDRDTSNTVELGLRVCREDDLGCVITILLCEHDIDAARDERRIHLARLRSGQRFDVSLLGFLLPS